MEWGPILSAVLGGIAGVLGAWATMRNSTSNAKSVVVAGYDSLVNQLQEQVTALAARVAALEERRRIDEEIIIRQTAELAAVRAEARSLKQRVAALEAKLRSLGIDPDEVQGVPI